MSQVDKMLLDCPTCERNEICPSSSKEGLAKILRKNQKTHCLFHKPVIVEVADFAEKHGISYTDAFFTLSFIGDQSIKLAERGLDVADYENRL